MNSYLTPEENCVQKAYDHLQAGLQPYPLALAALNQLANDDEVKAMWALSNYQLVHRLGYTNHGQEHAFLTAAAGHTLLNLALEAGEIPDIIRGNFGTTEDVQVAVLCALLLHDTGNHINRHGHEQHALTVCLGVLDRILTPLYPDVYKRTIIRGMILNAINSHDLKPRPYTFEGRLVALADGTDIARGRGISTLRLGMPSIHVLSVMDIERVEITQGTQRPINITVHLKGGSAGLFQVQGTLTDKIAGSGLKHLIDLYVQPGDPDAAPMRANFSGPEQYYEILNPPAIDAAYTAPPLNQATLITTILPAPASD